VPYCKNCNAELPKTAVYCKNCDAPIILEKKMWNIYSSLLTYNFPQFLEERSSQYSSLEIEYCIEDMAQMGLIFKSVEGEYELVDDRKLDILLPHLLQKEKSATLRRLFYLAFLITFFSILSFYYTFLPQEPFTTISFSFAIISFSLIAFTVEAVKRFHLMSFMGKILLARSRIS